MLTDHSILIVEDNGFLAVDLACAVEDYDGTVIGPSASVADAIVLLDAVHVSGAILDCHLVDRDITPIVEMLTAREIPFVVQTGAEIPAELERSHPGLKVFRKPLAAEAIVRALLHNIACGVERNVR